MKWSPIQGTVHENRASQKWRDVLVTRFLINRSRVTRYAIAIIRFTEFTAISQRERRASDPIGETNVGVGLKYGTLTGRFLSSAALVRRRQE
jgi:hypothetical protein